MTRLNVRFLLQQTIAFLLVAYFALIGGSQSGVLFYGLRRLSLIVLSLVVIAWWISWARRGFPFPRSRLDVVWLAFVLVQGVAVVLSTDPRRGITQFVLTVLGWLTFYLILDLLHRYGPDLLASTMVLLGLLLIALGATELVNWYQGWWEIGGWRHVLPPATVRLQAITPHPNFLAAYLNSLLPFGIVAWFKMRSRLARLALAAWSALVLTLIFFTSSRGGWLGTGTALALLLALDRQAWVVDRWRRLRRRPALLGLSGLLLTGVLVAGVFLLTWQARHPTHGPLLSSRQWLWAPVWAAFARSPLWGSGPLTYADQAMQMYSIPPVSLYTHAHSFLLNTLLESGVLGLLTLGGFAVAVTRSIFLQWRSLAAGSRSWLIAAIAGLAATLVHSLFETPQAVPGFTLLIVLILALIESLAPLPPRRLWVERGSRSLLALAWPALLIALVVGLREYALYARGIALANAGHYAEAAPLLDRVAARDPLLAANWFGAGYVHAKIALEKDDAAHLQEAIANYRAGIALEPYFAVNWANLGVLLWRAGDQDGAREALQRAVERAPQEAAFALTLGAFEEEVGHLTRAEKLYHQGLELRPEWANSFFFRASPLRAAVREQWLASWQAPARPHQVCWDALDAGDLGEARRCFSAARALNDPYPYYGLGLTEQAAGNLAQAEWNLRVATWISDPDPRDAARLAWALGDVLAQKGDLADAAAWYERALAKLKQPGPFHIDGITTGYIWFVFNREAIVDHYLPGVVWIIVTDDVAERMLQLGGWYERLGRTEDAARTYRELLEAVPDMAEAEERLRVLGEEIP